MALSLINYKIWQHVTGHSWKGSLCQHKNVYIIFCDALTFLLEIQCKGIKSKRRKALPVQRCQWPFIADNQNSESSPWNQQLETANDNINSVNLLYFL